MHCLAVIRSKRTSARSFRNVELDKFARCGALLQPGRVAWARRERDAREEERRPQPIGAPRGPRSPADQPDPDAASRTAAQVRRRWSRSSRRAAIDGCQRHPPPRFDEREVRPARANAGCGGRGEDRDHAGCSQVPRHQGAGPATAGPARMTPRAVTREVGFKPPRRRPNSPSVLRSAACAGLRGAGSP